MDHSTQPSQPLVQIDQVTKAFSRTRVLQDVTLSIPYGVIWGLTGPHGSGKTTLLKCIFGLCRPDTGRILVGGKQPCRLTRHYTSYCPETDSLYEYLSVQQTIRFTSVFYRDWDYQREKALIDLLEIDPHVPVRRLAKGDRGRLKLLLALSRQARLILLDEPLSGVDPLTRTVVLQAIVSEFRALEQSIILSTHEVMEALTIFDHIIMLDQGSIIQSGDQATPGYHPKHYIIERIAGASS